MKTITIVVAIMLMSISGCTSSLTNDTDTLTNQTPAQLAQRVLDSLRNHNKDEYVNKTLFTKHQAQQFAKHVQHITSVATEVEAFPWLAQFEQSRQNNIESWEGMLSQGTKSGITWSDVTFIRAEYDIKEHKGMRVAPGIAIVFSSKGSVYKVYIDDCFETPDGWLAADALRWQGKVD
jgi:hypothetical protein